MKRRGFLAGILGLAGFGVAAKAAESKPSARGLVAKFFSSPEEYERIPVRKCEVVTCESEAPTFAIARKPRISIPVDDSAFKDLERQIQAARQEVHWLEQLAEALEKRVEAAQKSIRGSLTLKPAWTREEEEAFAADLRTHTDEKGCVNMLEVMKRHPKIYSNWTWEQ